VPDSGIDGLGFKPWQQGLKPFIPAFISGTPENRGRSPLFSSPSLPAGWQNNTTEVVP
jgi:hypothetical protein